MTHADLAALQHAQAQRKAAVAEGHARRRPGRGERAAAQRVKVIGRLRGARGARGDGLGLEKSAGAPARDYETVARCMVMMSWRANVHAGGMR